MRDIEVTHIFIGCWGVVDPALFHYWPNPLVILSERRKRGGKDGIMVRLEKKEDGWYQVDVAVWPAKVGGGERGK